MTLQLDLTGELGERLTAEAERRGLSADECARQLLAGSLPPTGARAELVALLQSWIDEEDGGEQKETGDYLIRALDEDRLSDRKLFPPELEGVTW